MARTKLVLCKIIVASGSSNNFCSWLIGQRTLGRKLEFTWRSSRRCVCQLVNTIWTGNGLNRSLIYRREADKNLFVQDGRPGTSSSWFFWFFWISLIRGRFIRVATRAVALSGVSKGVPEPVTVQPLDLNVLSSIYSLSGVSILSFVILCWLAACIE